MWRGTRRGREQKEDRGGGSGSCTILPAALQQKSTQYTRATTQPPALHRTDPCAVQTERRHEDESRNTRCGGLPSSNRRLRRGKGEKCASETRKLSQSQEIYQALLFWFSVATPDWNSGLINYIINTNHVLYDVFLFSFWSPLSLRLLDEMRHVNKPDLYYSILTTTFSTLALYDDQLAAITNALYVNH